MSSEVAAVISKVGELEAAKGNQHETAAAPEQASASVAVKDEQEPQNDLTKAFTEQEWAGVKHLRSKLSDIAAEVYEDKGKTINLWSVELSSTPSAKASVVLVKFIRARPGDLEAAQQMLVSTLKWRHEFKPEDVKNESFPEIFSKVGIIAGKDKGGRPVTYNFYGSTDPNEVFKDVEQFIRWRVGLMERGIALIDFEKVDSMVQVHDYAGVSLLGGRTANSKAAAKQASAIFSDYYPELLYKKFFVSVPTVLTWIFWTFTSILSPATQNKMSVVGSGSATISAALLPVIDEKEIPKIYGGGLDI